MSCRCPKWAAVNTSGCRYASLDELLKEKCELPSWCLVKSMLHKISLKHHSMSLLDSWGRNGQNLYQEPKLDLSYVSFAWVQSSAMSSWEISPGPMITCQSCGDIRLDLLDPNSYQGVPKVQGISNDDSNMKILLKPTSPCVRHLCSLEYLKVVSRCWDCCTSDLNGSLLRIHNGNPKIFTSVRSKTKCVESCRCLDFHISSMHVYRYFVSPDTHTGKATHR